MSVFFVIFLNLRKRWKQKNLERKIFSILFILVSSICFCSYSIVLFHELSFMGRVHFGLDYLRYWRWVNYILLTIFEKMKVVCNYSIYICFQFNLMIFFKSFQKISLIIIEFSMNFNSYWCCLKHIIWLSCIDHRRKIIEISILWCSNTFFD